MTQSSTSGAVRTFRVASPLKRLIPLIITCVFTVGLIYVVSKPSERTFIPFLVAVLAFSVALAYWLMSRTRLVVSSDGIVNYSIGYNVRSTWGNIEGYGKRTLGSQTVECLILREPGIEVSRWMQIGYALMPAAQVAAAAQGRVMIPQGLSGYSNVIPVALYADDWRSSELGVLIKRYAPQAFENNLRKE